MRGCVRPDPNNPVASPGGAGLGADNVLSMDVVLANGSLVTVTRCSSAEPDLWWALRGGGGGTFGVVVSATHRLHPDPGVVILQASYPMSE